MKPAGFLTNGRICLLNMGLQAPGQSLSIADAVVSGQQLPSAVCRCLRLLVINNRLQVYSLAHERI